MELPDEAGQETRNAQFAIKRAMENEQRLKVTLPHLVDDQIIENL